MFWGSFIILEVETTFVVLSWLIAEFCFCWTGVRWSSCGQLSRFIPSGSQSHKVKCCRVYRSSTAFYQRSSLYSSTKPILATRFRSVVFMSRCAKTMFVYRRLCRTALLLREHCFINFKVRFSIGFCVELFNRFSYNQGMVVCSSFAHRMPTLLRSVLW